MLKKRYLDWHEILIKAVKDIDNYPPKVLGKRLGLSNSNFFRLCLKFQKLRDINNSFTSSLNGGGVVVISSSSSIILSKCKKLP